MSATEAPAKAGTPAQSFAKEQALWTERSGARARLAEAALEWLAREGLPEARDEAWLYTDVRRLAALGPPADAPASPFEVPRAWLHLSPFAPSATLVNGRLIGGPLRIAGATCQQLVGADGSLPAASLPGAPGTGTGDAGRTTPYGWLNAARFVDGLHVVFHGAKRLEGPLIVFHDTAPDGSGQEAARAIYNRLLVELEPAADAELIEIYRAHAGGPGAVVATTEVRIGRGAKLHHVRLQLQEDAALHVGSTATQVEAGGSYALVAATHGGTVDRHDVHLDMVGTGAEARIAGLYALRDRAHADMHAIVDHRTEHGRSSQLVKGVVGDHARGAFTGRVVIHPGAQHIDGKQSHHALLLADTARVDTRPQLEIYADDVQCAHGATVGQLDDEALFYLQSRGLGREAARVMLIKAFAWDVLADIRHEALRNDVQRLLEGRLAGVGTNVQ